MTRLATLAWLCAGLGACSDPITEARIAALGGERAGVSPSEYHRPGQPCTVCHGEYGHAEPKILIGGTVFAQPGRRLAVADAVVILTDREGATLRKTTNCIGNFYVTEDEWSPEFPLRAAVECPDPSKPGARRTTPMATRIGRDGSCAACHIDNERDADSRTQRSPGRVYCTKDPAVTFPPIDPACPGKL